MNAAQITEATVESERQKENQKQSKNKTTRREGAKRDHFYLFEVGDWK